MSKPKTPMLSAKIEAIKRHQLSPDKNEIAIVLNTKHVGDLSILLLPDHLDQLTSIIRQIRSEMPSRGDQHQMRVVVPKNWLVAADLKIHDVVVVVFNRQTEAQTAYALKATAAKELADGLIRNADAVLDKKGARKAPLPNTP